MPQNEIGANEAKLILANISDNVDITQIYLQVKKWNPQTRSWREVGKIDMFQDTDIKEAIKAQWNDGKYQGTFYYQNGVRMTKIGDQTIRPFVIIIGEQTQGESINMMSNEHLDEPDPMQEITGQLVNEIKIERLSNVLNSLKTQKESTKDKDKLDEINEKIEETQSKLHEETERIRDEMRSEIWRMRESDDDRTEKTQQEGNNLLNFAAKITESQANQQNNTMQMFAGMVHGQTIKQELDNFKREQKELINNIKKEEPKQDGTLVIAQMIAQMQQSNMEMLKQTIAAPKQDNTPVIAQMIAQMQQSNMEMLKQMAAAPKQDSTLVIAQMIAQMQQSNMEMYKMSSESQANLTNILLQQSQQKPDTDNMLIQLIPVLPQLLDAIKPKPQLNLKEILEIPQVLSLLEKALTPREQNNDLMSQVLPSVIGSVTETMTGITQKVAESIIDQNSTALPDPTLQKLNALSMVFKSITPDLMQIISTMGNAIRPAQKQQETKQNPVQQQPRHQPQTHNNALVQSGSPFLNDNAQPDMSGIPPELQEFITKVQNMDTNTALAEVRQNYPGIISLIKTNDFAAQQISGISPKIAALVKEIQSK